MAKTLEGIGADMADITGRVRGSLVQIRNGGRGAGAGSIWHPDGLIVTNAHVVGSRSIHVILPDGRELPGRLMAREPSLDLAALKVDTEGLPAIELGDSRNLRPGEMVISLGHPWGVEGAAAAGVVIGVGPGPPDSATSGREWVIASLRLRPGHSGGPMVDSRGRLIGINTMITGPAVAMAVPVHVAKDFLQRALKAGQSRTEFELEYLQVPATLV